MDHLKALQNKKKLEARGEPSLMNVMEMARSGLSCVVFILISNQMISSDSCLLCETLVIFRRMVRER